jgi:hypothetical protein
MDKRGDLSMQFIVISILALIVLVVIVLVFRTQIINFISSITDLSSGLGTDINDASQDLLP